MKKLFTFAIICIAIIFTSCKKQESLQSYLIQTDENQNYVRFDFSTSMLGSFFEDISEEDQKTFESIRKMNIAFLPVHKTNEEEFGVERKKIKEIMKNTNYKSLIRVNDKRGKGTVYYNGEADAIDEIVAVIYAKDFGFGVARILGNDMNIEKIMKMVQSTNMEDKGVGLEKIKDIFGGQFQTEKLYAEPIQ
ncbi:hypothetical protein BTO06_07935 [Tenacibaculum sp. SZ-18]|uniref:DUF4252 domain-containing protein n=1 Tax=Tenacibaculum sp. SZ-18 TaxID=754423 RepID=UPI000C2D613A|nr:DUF4252 domain-containing protein [Tenacibaculum sp. SZ-18]AUC15068.1 hypothetical protein BTO06_07935 [Tenacibaculum sp. SZ-18]